VLACAATEQPFCRQLAGHDLSELACANLLELVSAPIKIGPKN